MSIVNGLGAPAISVNKKDGSTVNITMPAHLPEKNSETPNQQKVKHPSFDFSDIVDRVGFKPRFTISYRTMMDGVDLLALRHLLESSVEEITLTPHVDLPGRKFKVDLISFGEWERLGKAEMHKGIEMVFESTELLDAIPFPQAALSGRTWAGCGTETWADHAANVWHFFM